MKDIIDQRILDQYPRLLRVWTRMYELYYREKEQELERLSDLFYKTDKVKDRTKSASEAKRDLAEILELYFEYCQKGREAGYIISFVPGTPRLRIEPRIDEDEILTSKPQEGSTAARINAKLRYWVIHFVTIFKEAWLHPEMLIIRSRKSKFVNADALLLYLVVTTIAYMIIYRLIERLPVLRSFPTAQNYLQAEASKIISIANLLYDLLIKIPLLAVTFWIPFRVLKGKISFFAMANFQIYFFYGWFPFIFLASLFLMIFKLYLPQVYTVSGWCFLIGLLYMLYANAKTIIKLAEMRPARGVASYVAGLIAALAMSRVLS